MKAVLSLERAGVGEKLNPRSLLHWDWKGCRAKSHPTSGLAAPVSGEASYLVYGTQRLPGTCIDRMGPSPDLTLPSKGCVGPDSFLHLVDLGIWDLKLLLRQTRLRSEHRWLKR